MAALSLQFAPRARHQLNSILQFIAMDNPDAASRIAGHVDKLMEHTRSFPEMGRIVFEGLPHREVTTYSMPNHLPPSRNRYLGCGCSEG